MIVITAATPWEARPLAARWGLQTHDGSTYAGEIQGRRVVVARTGIGGEKTARALERLKPEGALIAVSSGLCGGLQPGVESGDLVADLRGAPLEAVETARDTARSLGMTLHMGALHTAESLVPDPNVKRELGLRMRAIAVDMESEAVREWAAARGGLFVGLRVVLDAVDDRLPEGMLEDDSPAAVAGFVRKHWRDITLLAKTGLRQRKAIDRLSRFLDAWLRRFEA